MDFGFLWGGFSGVTVLHFRVRVTRLLLGVVCGVSVRFASHLVRSSAIVVTTQRFHMNSYQKNWPQNMSRVVY